jgi:hypothetical protein
MQVENGLAVEYVSYQVGVPVSYHYLTRGRGSVFVVIYESHRRTKNKLSGLSETGGAY